MKYNVDLKTADTILQNVFTTCEVAPNRIPFEKIVNRKRANVVLEAVGIWTSIIFFFLTLITPVFLPHGDVKISTTADYEIDVVSHHFEKNTLTIVLSGPVDASSSYIIDPKGKEAPPVDYDTSQNMILFHAVRGEYNIYIYDLNGKEMQFILSVP